MSGEGAADGLTRRAVLRGAAVAGAAMVVRPAGGLARADGVFSRWVGALGAGRESSPIAAPGVFSLVGVEWSDPASAGIELRARSVGGAWSPWVTASVLGHGPDRVSDGGAQFGEPVWTGPADQVQLRSSVAVGGVRLHFVAPPAVGASGVSGAPGASGAAGLGGGAHAAQGLPLAQPVLDAGPGQPPIIARGAWAHGQAHPTHLPEYATVKLAFIHHSETANGYGPGAVPSILMSIFAYHVYVRGFWDIAYNFAVDEFGGIWEARAGGIDLPVMGAHAGGYNTESTGIVVLGSFSNLVPSPAALSAVERLLAWKLSLHGVPVLGRVTVEVDPSGAIYTAFAPGARVSLPRVAGHRDGDQTSCPGDAFYAQLPSMRPRVAALVGAPAKLTIAAPSSPVGVGTNVAVTGSLTQLGSGAPVTDAPIELQQVGVHGAETTIASTTTDAGGAWSFTVPAAQTVMLRAVHQPAPAAVSDVAILSVAPVLMLTLESSAPVQVSGTVSPAGTPVTVDLYRKAGGKRHLVVSKRVSGAGGTFGARFGSRRPGHYVVVARTPASNRFAAGSTAPVAVTIG